MSLLEDDWSYFGQPDDLAIDHVRELVGDTDKNTKLVSDTTIQFALDNQGQDARMAAAKVAEKIGARFTKEASSKSGKDYSRSMDRSKAFFDLADLLKSSDSNTIPSAAQIRCSTSAALYSKADIRRGAFRTGMFHAPEFDPRVEVTDQDLLNDSRGVEES